MTSCESLLARIRRRWFALAALTTPVARAAAASLPLAAGGSRRLGSSACGLARSSPCWRLARGRRPRPAGARALPHAAPAGRPPGRAVRRGAGRYRRVCRRRCATRWSARFEVAGVARIASRRLRGPARRQRGRRCCAAIEPASVIPPAALRRAALQAAAGAALLALAARGGAAPAARRRDGRGSRLFPRSIDIHVVPATRASPPAGRSDRARRSRAAARACSRVAPSLVVSRERPAARRCRCGAAATASAIASSPSIAASSIASSRAAPHRDAYSVTALFPPRVTAIELHYEYPSFTGLAAARGEGRRRHLRPGRHARAAADPRRQAAGGRRAGAGRAAQPVALRTGDDRPLGRARPRRRRRLSRAADGSPTACASDGDVEYFIRLMDDRPPDVHIVRPSGDQGITPLEEVAIEARADDDYGIAQFDLVYAVAGRPPKTVPFTRRRRHRRRADRRAPARRGGPRRSSPAT